MFPKLEKLFRVRYSRRRPKAEPLRNFKPVCSPLEEDPMVIPPDTLAKLNRGLLK